MGASPGGAGHGCWRCRKSRRGAQRRAPLQSGPAACTAVTRPRTFTPPLRAADARPWRVWRYGIRYCGYPKAFFPSLNPRFSARQNLASVEAAAAAGLDPLGVAGPGLSRQSSTSRSRISDGPASAERAERATRVRTIVPRDPAGCPGGTGARTGSTRARPPGRPCTSRCAPGVGHGLDDAAGAVTGAARRDGVERMVGVILREDRVRRGPHVDGPGADLDVRDGRHDRLDHRRQEEAERPGHVEHGLIRERLHGLRQDRLLRAEVSSVERDRVGDTLIDGSCRESSHASAGSSSIASRRCTCRGSAVQGGGGGGRS